MEKSLVQLSKQVSHALRHEPWLYELELDDEGWVPVEALLTALRTLKGKWTHLSEADLIEMINQSSKKRHEIKNGKIRALYGHSIPHKLAKKTAEPPSVLYHGTSSKNIPTILKEGLKPMGRHYVHLSSDIETAHQVGARKSKNPKILTIRAKEAYLNKVNFYIGNDKVWLADHIPSVYIDSLEYPKTA